MGLSPRDPNRDGRSLKMPPPMGRTTPEGTAGITVSKTGGQGLSPRASQPKATARVQPENGMHGETQPRRTTEGGAVAVPPQHAVLGRSCPTAAPHVASKSRAAVVPDQTQLRGPSHLPPPQPYPLPAVAHSKDVPHAGHRSPPPSQRLAWQVAHLHAGTPTQTRRRRRATGLLRRSPAPRRPTTAASTAPL